MDGNGWKSIKVYSSTWKELMLLKIRMNKRSIDEVIRELIAGYKK